MKVGMLTQSFMNNSLLNVGAKSGLDNVMAGAAVGGGLGAINGAFSDYEGVFSGALKGATVGGVGMTGLKYAGSRYASNYSKKVGSLTNDMAGSAFQKNNFNVDTKLFKDPGKDFDWFNGEFAGAKNTMEANASKFSDYRNGVGAGLGRMTSSDTTALSGSSPFGGSSLSTNTFTHNTNFTV